MMRTGSLQQAISAAQAWVRDAPADARAWLAFSEVLSAARAFTQAAQCAEKAATLDRAPLYRATLARAKIQAGDMAAGLMLARELAAKPQEPAGHEAPVCSLLAKCFTLAGCHTEALPFARQAAALMPDEMTLQYNAALAERACGHLNAAITRLDRVIEANPSDWQAVKARSDLRCWTPSDNHIQTLKDQRPDEASDATGFVLVSAALAKEHADIGAHTEAFGYLAEGAAARRRQIRYDVQSDIKVMEQLAEHHNAAFLADGAASPSSGPTPIFILGLPRAGSTLLERVLSGADAVAAMGELSDFPKAYMKQLRQLQKTNAAVDPVLLSTRLDFDSLRAEYLRGVQARGRDASLFIDKLPMNFLNIGLIHRALPHAKILHIHKNPMDACYSIFKAFFGDGHPYSYDLQELASYFAAYQTLMAHWRQALPAGVMLDIAYEDFVADPGAATKTIASFLGLDAGTDFSKAVADGHATDSASAAQVRAPIDSRAIGAWRAVADQLAPLRDALQRLDCLD